MKAKDIVIIVLLIALALVGYLLGFRSGQLRDMQIREARGRLTIALALYETAQRGDLQKLRSDLGMVVLGETRAFEREFGEPSGTNSFAQRFARALNIAAQVESTLVPLSSILTNFPHTPDAKIGVRRE